MQEKDTQCAHKNSSVAESFFTGSDFSGIKYSDKVNKVKFLYEYFMAELLAFNIGKDC